jgi:quinol-cytochrome oxidoreductase complex cytochrome b subunit/coenzyme F420-reducing hydrogenase delta subunit
MGIKRAGQRAFERLEAWFNLAFGTSNNPFYHLGALCFYFYFIVVITGVYLFIYYPPSVKESFDMMEYLSREQWYLGGVMRSLHRYASDALILVMILHLLREYCLDRYRGARWFSWLTTVPVLLLIFPVGITGYWMVWDKLGQFIAVRSSEWLDWLPIIAEPIARNFLTNLSVTDLFFRLMFIVHLALSIFLIVAMLVHVARISKADINPPAPLAWGTMIALLILSLIEPVHSHMRADLSLVPSDLQLDWFYMFFYPLMEVWSMGALWALAFLFLLLVALLPWLPARAEDNCAEVWLDECSGCALCVADCPYEALYMQPRSDGHRHFNGEVVVVADHCVGCGICVGSCPSSTPFRRTSELKTGIDLPGRSIQQLRSATLQALANLSGEAKVIVFGCDHGADLSELETDAVVTMKLPCIGALPPSFIDYAMRNGADGVFLTGCRGGDCLHRFGNTWTEGRLDESREPHLRHWVPRQRLNYFWASSGDLDSLRCELKHFRHALYEHKQDNPAAASLEKGIDIGHG